ncbi:MAG TPA: LD-carboxypeptidase [Cytophagaceae bacterium]|jgi:muramoyltetrapeptide carboxypeptidase|nr:LD-carboxypeptidase [Cytophagaceae bacterium]
MYIKPPFIKKNDKVAIIATAKNFDKKELVAAIKNIKSWGLEVIEGKHLYKKHHQFAGTDLERTEELQWALDDSEIKAVFCARGGYGTAKIIDEISFKKIIKHPKWVIGFSDVTVLHAQLQKNKMQSIHGVMPILFGQKDYKLSVEKLKEAIFGKEIRYKILPNKLNREGEATGKLIGGNLSIICSLIGTSSEMNTKDKILFLEDVGENLYRIDRMIVQLKRAEKLKMLSGLIMGHFTAIEDNEIKFGKTAYEIIADAVKEYSYPVCFGFPAGHEADNLPLILGAELSLAVSKKGVNVNIK